MKITDYATVEAVCGGIPIYSFRNMAYIYGQSPDLYPQNLIQENNFNTAKKLALKKSWEIEFNYAGAEHEMTPRTFENDSLPMLPIHLIDGNPDTIWASWGSYIPDERPEWIRIDLPAESDISAVNLICNKNYMGNEWSYGCALPKKLRVKISRDAREWTTVYENDDLSDTSDDLKIVLEQNAAAKQILIEGFYFPQKARYINHVFSIAEVEILDKNGVNLALVSRGAGVTVSSVSYGVICGKYTQDCLWGPLQYDLGNKWTRLGPDNGSFTWCFTEHEPGKMQIDPCAEAAIAECAQNGVNVILCLDFKGNWIYMDPPRKTNWEEARYKEINDLYTIPPGEVDLDPVMFEKYMKYIDYMTEKFGDKVAYIEIGNEWNLRMDVDRYVNKILKPTLKRIKAINPRVKILIGSVCEEYPAERLINCLCEGAVFDQTSLNVTGAALFVRESDSENGKTGNPKNGAVQQILQNQGPLGADDLVSQITGPEGEAEHPQDNTDESISFVYSGRAQAAAVLRFRDKASYITAVYDRADQLLYFSEIDVISRYVLPEPEKLDAVPICEMGDSVKMSAEIRDDIVYLTVSDSDSTFTASHRIQKTFDGRKLGFMHQPVYPQSLTLRAEFSEIELPGEKENIYDSKKWQLLWNHWGDGETLADKADALGWHPIARNATRASYGTPMDKLYFDMVRHFQKECEQIGFKGEWFADEIYVGSIYPASGTLVGITEFMMAKYLLQSLVGHAGLNTFSGPCHPHFTGFPHAQSLCRVPVPEQTQTPCQPKPAYYTWRNTATAMDGFRAAAFPYRLSDDTDIMRFTFKKGDKELMIGLWYFVETSDAAAGKKTNLVIENTNCSEVIGIDLFNGTETQLNYTNLNENVLIKDLLIKDYPILIKLRLTERTVS